VSVRHALLALLSEGPKYGLQLGQEFEARTGEVWPLNTGQVYSTLQRLERDGLVEADGTGEDGPQKGFRITPSGADELRAWLHTPPSTSAPPRDELVIKVLVAMRVPGVDVVELVQAHRRHLIEAMHHYTRLKEGVGDHDLGLLLVADAELYRLDAVVRWLDAAEGRIRRAPVTAVTDATSAPTSASAPMTTDGGPAPAAAPSTTPPDPAAAAGPDTGPDTGPPRATAPAPAGRRRLGARR
jgi:DNA-binding PadR family transcriptional regulator